MIKQRIFNLLNFSYDKEINLIDFDGVYVKYDGEKEEEFVLTETYNCEENIVYEVKMQENILQ